MRNQYERRLIRVLEYIHDNPDGDLSLDALADVAAMSRFHWHRVFRAMTGETIADAVRRTRLHLAACWLVETDWPISEVSKRAGFSNAKSFGRIFKDHHSKTPLAFRRAGRAPQHIQTSRSGHFPMYEIQIRQAPARQFSGLAHIGPYAEIGRSFERVSAIVTARNLWPTVSGMAGIYYDDPSSVVPQALRSHAGVIVSPDFESPEDFDTVALPEGEEAVLLFRGPYSGLSKAYDFMWGEWLPSSAREPADTPPFEIYLNAPRDTAPDQLLTEICMPLRAA